MERMWYTNLLTRTRSWGARVFSIDPDGIQNAWTKNVLIATASTSAMTTRMGSSFQKDRCFFLPRPCRTPASSPCCGPRCLVGPGITLRGHQDHHEDGVDQFGVRPPPPEATPPWPSSAGSAMPGLGDGRLRAA